MGTPEQKERFLGPLPRARPPALGLVRDDRAGRGLRRRRDPHQLRDATATHWVLDGDKSFAANASRADWIVVWATVDPAPGRAGHRAFVVERGTPGLGDFKIEKKMGLKAYESTSFTLRDCRVPAANLLGGEEHYASRAPASRARCSRSTRRGR